MAKDYFTVNPKDYNMKDLRKMVYNMSYNANRRISRIEKKGLSSSAARLASKRYGLKNSAGFRFSTKLSKLNQKQLENQFNILKEFMLSDSSTVRGAENEQRQSKLFLKRYNLAKEKGFKGSAVKFQVMSNVLWTEVNEKRLSSDVAFYLIQSEDINLMNKILAMDKKNRDSPSTLSSVIKKAQKKGN